MSPPGSRQCSAKVSLLPVPHCPERTTNTPTGRMIERDPKTRRPGGALGWRAPRVRASAIGLICPTRAEVARLIK